MIASGNIDSLISDAQLIRNVGIRVYPVGEDKQPIGGARWSPWRLNPPADDNQIATWAKNPKTHGWAGLCGAHDDGIAAVDIEAIGMEVPTIKAATLQAPTFCQYASKSGGVHIWVDITDVDTAGPVLTESLAYCASGIADNGRPEFDLLAEVRGASKSAYGSGAYAVIVGPGRPPLRSDFRPWKITRAEFDALVAPIRALDEQGPWKAARAAEKAANARNRPARPIMGITTADLILDAVATGGLRPEDVLPEGWEHVGDHGNLQLIRRPGATSPTSGNVKDGVFAIWSSAVTWADPGDHLPAAKVLAESRHDGDFAAAMAAVEAAALGEPSPYSTWPRHVLDPIAANVQAQRQAYRDQQDNAVAAWINPASDSPDQSRQQSRHVLETGNSGETGNTGPRLWAGTELRPSEPTRWLAKGQLPLGQVAVLIGDEGIGKSLWWVLVVAHITTGAGDDRLRIPPAPPRDVVLVLTEDSWTNDVRPRLEAAGADLAHVHVLAEEDDGSGSAYFPRDFAVIEQAAGGLDIALVVVDAWLDTVQSGLQVKDPQQARQALHPWRNLAQTTGAGVLLLAHSNRADDGSLRNRVGATGALRQKARVLLYAARPPEQDDILFIGADKANGTALHNAIAYRLEVQQLRPATDDDQGTIARLKVIGDTGATMESHYAQWRADARRADNPDADERAWQWLANYIANHGEDTALGRQVNAAAAKDAAKPEGINPKRLAKAIKTHGGYAGPDGAGAEWVYRVHKSREATLERPRQSLQSCQSSQSPEHGETGGETAGDTATRAPDDVVIEFEEVAS